MTKADPLLSDDEIIALTRKKIRQRKLGILLTIFPVGLLAALAGWRLAAWHLSPQPFPFALVVACGIAMLFLLAAIPTIFYFTRLPCGAFSARILVRRIDELQWQVRRFLLIVVPFSLLALAYVAEIGAVRILNHGFRPADCLMIVWFLLFGFLVLAFLTPYGIGRTMRPVLDDELSRTMRMRALALGFWIVTPGLVVLLALNLYDRNLVVEMMIPLLYLAIAVPALRYCYLDWRAGQGRHT